MAPADRERIEAIRKWYLAEPETCAANFLLSRLSALTEALTAAQSEKIHTCKICGAECSC